VTTTDRVAPLPLPRAGREDPWTWPNLISLARTVLALAVGAVAATERSLTLLAVAYGVYWVGDVLDGWVARRTGTETRQGAVLDILCDRASCGMLAVTYLNLVPSAAPAITVFLLQFMVVDCMLSLGFLRWPVLSPNYFATVDRTIYLWNWSPAAKATNTAALILVVAAGWYGAALLLALAQLAVKSVSLVALTRLPDPV
jgi:phosphatidylglycerophosphate synthase